MHSSRLFVCYYFFVEDQATDIVKRLRFVLGREKQEDIVLGRYPPKNVSGYDALQGASKLVKGKEAGAPRPKSPYQRR